MKTCRNCRKIWQKYNNPNIVREFRTRTGKKWPDNCYHNEPTRLCAHHHSLSLSYGAKRRSAKLNATPSWANLKEIQQIYKNCSEVQRITRIKHQVDHIIPLLGENVCGLHVENNLQIITSTANAKKGNKLLPAYR